MQKNLFNISSQLGVLLNNCSPQVKGNSLEWYLAGSLATMIMGDVLELSEVLLDENNNIISFDEKIVLDNYQRTKIKSFKRKLGSDIDVVNVNGDMFGGADYNNKPSISFIKRNIPDIIELIPVFELIGGTGYIDNLEQEHNIGSHNVTKVVTSNGTIFITSIPEQIAFKLNDLLVIQEVCFYGDNERAIEHYKKDVRDILFMIYGYKDLYSKEMLVNRISNALNYSLNQEIIDKVLMYFRKEFDVSKEINELIDFLEYLLVNVYNNQKESNRIK